MQRLGWLGKAFAFVALVGLTGGCVSQQKYDNLLDHNRRLTGLLNDKEQESQRLQADLQQSKSALDTTTKLAEGLDKDNEALRQAMERSRQMGSELEKQLGGLTGVSIDGGKVSLEGEVFFDSGKATIKKAMEETLKKVASALKSRGLTFRIDGHTDPVPISHSGWKSNMDLSAARALTVFHFFEDDGIASTKMYIAAYGPNKPKVQGNTPEAYNQDRRVELLLLSGVTLGPSAGAPTAAPKKGTGPAPKKAAPAPEKPKT
jgi:chemotaxis protein MotB